MSNIIVYKNRTNIVTVNLGIDVSSDTFSSQIRKTKSSTSALIASWTVSFKTNGTDGMLVLTLDNSITSLITGTTGYMDIKRIIGSEPFAVFSEPLEVTFRDTVTL
jgi:hypothetical protein